MKEKFSSITIAGVRTLGRRLAPLMLISALALGVTHLKGQSLPLGYQFPLYVHSNGNGSIVQLDSSGNQTLFVADSGCTSPPGIQGMAFDTMGNLYLACLSSGILKVDSSGNVTTFASGGLVSSPEGLAFDSTGILYVSTDANSIIKIDSSGNQSLFTSGGNISSPNGLAFDSSGNLYVTNTGTSKVIKVDSSGNQSIFATLPFDFFAWLAFDTAGNLYAPDGLADIYKIDTSGNASLFTAAGNFSGFSGLAFDANGNLYVADQINNSVIKVNSTGLQTVFASNGNFASPDMVAFTRPAVSPYTFSGFMVPVSNPPTINTGHAGRAYPLEWQLTNASGAFVSSLSAVKSITFEAVSCSTFAGEPANAMPTNTTGNSGLQYDTSTNTYQYNWKTPSQAGCYDLFLSFDTGQVFTAYFNLQ